MFISKYLTTIPVNIHLMVGQGGSSCLAIFQGKTGFPNIKNSLLKERACKLQGSYRNSISRFKDSSRTIQGLKLKCQGDLNSPCLEKIGVKALIHMCILVCMSHWLELFGIVCVIQQSALLLNHFILI